MRELVYGKIDLSEIILSENELSARLGYRVSLDDTVISHTVDEVLLASDISYCAALVRAKYAEGRVDLGFGLVESTALLKNLDGSSEVYVFAVTLGLGVDRLIKRKSAISTAEGFVINAVASAIAEAATDRAEQKIKGDRICRPRFSPGYADFSLSYQRALLSMLDAERRIGIALTEANLMIPTKSVTAIFGVKESN